MFRAFTGLVVSRKTSGDPSAHKIIFVPDNIVTSEHEGKLLRRLDACRGRALVPGVSAHHEYPVRQKWRKFA